MTFSCSIDNPSALSSLLLVTWHGNIERDGDKREPEARHSQGSEEVGADE
jgi:hypothetical protein